MVHYLIEFRFFGKAKYDIKKLIYEIDKKFKIGRAKRKRPIPHITLIAPFYTKNQKRLVGDFKSTCQKYSNINFKVQGYGAFNDTRVVYFKINPSQQMKSFRQDLISKFKPYCQLNNTDLSKPYSPHATIVMKLDKGKFKKVGEYIRRKDEFNYNHIMVRATIIKGGRILYEYDFMLRKLLNRKEAKSRCILSKTYEKINEFIDNKQKTSKKDEKINIFNKIWRFLTN